MRTLARTPGFTLAALLALTLGIGATTAVFSVVDAVLLRPLPYPDPERLVMIFSSRPQLGIERGALAMPTSWTGDRAVVPSRRSMSSRSTASQTVASL